MELVSGGGRNAGKTQEGGVNPAPTKSTAPASEGGRYKSKRNPRGRVNPARTKARLTDALGFPPERAFGLSRPDFLLWRRCFRGTASFAAALPVFSDSCGKSLRSGSLCAERRFVLPARLASGTTGRGTL